MPFTLSHPAAVLPLVRPAARFRATSALVIGSMIPDLPYFIPWPRTTFGSHSLIGLLTFCVPVGLVAVIIFELVLRRPLIFLLPESLRHSMSRQLEPIPVLHTAVAAILALLLGAFTHILWDSLTDPNSITLGHTPWAQRNLITIGGYHLYVYRLVEHCGTLLGAGAIAWVVRRSCLCQALRPARLSSHPEERFRVTALATILAIPSAAGVYAGTRADLPSEWLQATRYFLHRSVIWGGRIGGLVICIYSAIWWARHAKLCGREQRVDADDAGAERGLAARPAVASTAGHGTGDVRVGSSAPSRAPLFRDAE
jgi:hypothetical protein